MSPEELMSRVQADPNAVSPSEFAAFQKLGTDDGSMRTGDEFVVRMAAPWDGPVRVVEVSTTSFRLVTLEGHLEAGQIEFRLARDGEALLFEIESWARSADWLTDALYDRLRISKEVQVHMWSSVIERTARLAGGKLVDGITLETRRIDDPASAPLRDPRSRRALAALHDKAVTFGHSDRSRVMARPGWHLDRYCQSLPRESPGRPEIGRSYAVAQRLMRDYEFADPKIIRAVYEDTSPLEGRDMLLRARWHGLQFHFGVRVTGVVDELREVDNRSVAVWGWSYSTLQGHLEIGEMDYELWKWTDTGEVEFRIQAFSRRAHVRNPVVGLGFRIFGRREQQRFARHACARMAHLVASELEPGYSSETPLLADAATVTAG